VKKSLLVICVGTLCLGVLSFAAVQSKRPLPVPGDASRGRKVFEIQCEGCHEPNGTTVKVGPGLQRLFKRGKLANGNQCNESSVRSMIESGGKSMPSFAQLRNGDKDDLIAYLKSL